MGILSCLRGSHEPECVRSSFFRECLNRVSLFVREARLLNGGSGPVRENFAPMREYGEGEMGSRKEQEAKGDQKTVGKEFHIFSKCKGQEVIVHKQDIEVWNST